MGKDNEKLLRPTGERASLENVSLIPLASTGLKIKSVLISWLLGQAESVPKEALMRVG